MSLSGRRPQGTWWEDSLPLSTLLTTEYKKLTYEPKAFEAVLMHLGTDFTLIATNHFHEGAVCVSLCVFSEWLILIHVLAEGSLKASVSILIFLDHRAGIQRAAVCITNPRPFFILFLYCFYMLWQVQTMTRTVWKLYMKHPQYSNYDLFMTPIHLATERHIYRIMFYDRDLLYLLAERDLYVFLV